MSIFQLAYDLTQPIDERLAVEAFDPLKDLDSWRGFELTEDERQEWTQFYLSLLPRFPEESPTALRVHSVFREFLLKEFQHSRHDIQSQLESLMSEGRSLRLLGRLDLIPEASSERVQYHRHRLQSQMRELDRQLQNLREEHRDNLKSWAFLTAFRKIRNEAFENIFQEMRDDPVALTQAALDWLFLNSNENPSAIHFFLTLLEALDSDLGNIILRAAYSPNHKRRMRSFIDSVTAESFENHQSLLRLNLLLWMSVSDTESLESLLHQSSQSSIQFLVLEMLGNRNYEFAEAEGIIGRFLKSTRRGRLAESALEKLSSLESLPVVLDLIEQPHSWAPQWTTSRSFNESLLENNETTAPEAERLILDRRRHGLYDLRLIGENQHERLAGVDLNDLNESWLRNWAVENPGFEHLMEELIQSESQFLTDRFSVEKAWFVESLFSTLRRILSQNLTIHNWEDPAVKRALSFYRSALRGEKGPDFQQNAFVSLAGISDPFLLEALRTEIARLILERKFEPGFDATFVKPLGFLLGLEWEDLRLTNEHEWEAFQMRHPSRLITHQWWNRALRTTTTSPHWMWVELLEALQQNGHPEFLGQIKDWQVDTLLQFQDAEEDRQMSAENFFMYSDRAIQAIERYAQLSSESLSASEALDVVRSWGEGDSLQPLHEIVETPESSTALLFAVAEVLQRREHLERLQAQVILIQLYRRLREVSPDATEEMTKLIRSLEFIPQYHRR